MTVQPLPRAPAAERNREVILERLVELFAHRRSVLEIGSGTGQHAVHFAPRLSQLTWQASDVADNLPVINAWIRARPAANLPQAVELDVLRADWPVKAVDGVFSANTAHIMSWPAVTAMFEGVGRVLVAGGIFALYGPFFFTGVAVPSNQRFDRSLRASDPTMGVREVDRLAALGLRHGLRFLEALPMPANNHILVWRRSATPGGVSEAEPVG